MRKGIIIVILLGCIIGLMTQINRVKASGMESIYDDNSKIVQNSDTYGIDERN